MLKQYNPKKPDKWGFKAFVLSESKSGYVLDWSLYSGKAADDDASVTHRIVRSLMAVHIGKGHELYIATTQVCLLQWKLSTQLSQYIEYSMSSVVGSGTQGSPDVKQLITRTIGPQPIIQATIGEVTVDCLVDSGSQVSMIEECFFKQHPRAKNLTDDGNERKEMIVEKVLFKDVQTMLIMLFYQAVLPLLKNYVVLFHSKALPVHKLHDRQEQLSRDFLSCFIK